MYIQHVELRTANKMKTKYQTVLFMIPEQQKKKKKKKRNQVKNSEKIG